jgi:hypothetical protein
MRRPFHDPLLGDVVPSERWDWAWETELHHEGRTILVHIDPDGEPIDGVLARARMFMASPSSRIAEAFAAVAKEFLESYNIDWRPEGEPELTSAQFVARLTPSCIYFIGPDLVEVMFDDGGLFAGHSLVGQAFDGVVFDSATIYG